MAYESLSNIWASYSLPAVSAYINDKPKVSLFKGLSGLSCNSFLICSLFRDTQQPIVVFVENNKRSEILANECRSLINDQSVLLFPSRDSIPYNLKSPFGPTVELRLNTLHKLINGDRKIIIAPYTTLLQKTIPQRNLFNKIIHLRCNDEVPIETLSQWLLDIGFHRENKVFDIGTFSIHGGIVDIYPFISEHPYRIEFFGNTIESIRLFDVFSQKSIEHCRCATVLPMKEFCFSSRQILEAEMSIKSFCTNSHKLNSAFHKLNHQWNIGEYEGIEWFLHWFNQPTASILDYLSDDTILIWDSPIPIGTCLNEARNNYQRHFDRAPALFQPLLSPPGNLLYSDDYILERLSCFSVIYLDTMDIPECVVTYSVNVSRQPTLPNEIKAICGDLKKHILNNYRCILICQNQDHIDRMKELLEEISSSIEFVAGFLSQGYIDHYNRIVFYSESRIFSRSIGQKKGKKPSITTALTGFNTLDPDDYVVHEDHGIARFLGIEQIMVGDSKQDCMVLLYAEGTRISVPVQDFYKVRKYIGKDSSPPQLSKIGTGSWEKLKVKTRKSIKETVGELISLYAKRQYGEGIAFDLDTIWQKEFEEAFIYEETVDQLNAVKEIKKDMESPKPMDRLVCGDVGFGKTEVAMRAAFKAVMSGYQVAVLAPTTILVAQHCATFSERMRNFPVKIVAMSRFNTSAQQKINIDKIKSGDVDIVIGTHRILSDDIFFKNLGLLIIDEEHKFGVKHKEKIKQLSYKIDVLSLTATPIPRTLQFSLINIRDLSIIATPPKDRLPIETVVCPYHEEQVKIAIENELERGGQVYFVNNLIKPLERIKDTIEQLVPKARVVIAHGQMNEELLENIMKQFIAGRYDVLLSTTIIENGIDIPNVNTIIVNRADKMGLSQLYQLRGRVGRSSEQAYSYFFTPPFKEINETTLKRLKALEQYTELGSGFQIAMLDLEIRGAGNILGTKQHGFIDAIGFDLYCRILQETINEMKGVPQPPKASEVHIDIPVEAFIPTEYIPDGSSRISLYQELASITDISMIPEFEKSIADRHGPFPQPIVSLINIQKIKILAISLGITKIVLSNNSSVTIFFDGNDDFDNKNLLFFNKNLKYQIQINSAVPLSINFMLFSTNIQNQCLELIDLLSLAISSRSCDRKDEINTRHA